MRPVLATVEGVLQRTGFPTRQLSLVYRPSRTSSSSVVVSFLAASVVVVVVVIVVIVVVVGVVAC